MWFWQITGQRVGDYHAFANASAGGAVAGRYLGQAERGQLNLFRIIELATGAAIAMTFA